MVDEIKVKSKKIGKLNRLYVKCLHLLYMNLLLGKILCLMGEHPLI